MDILLEFFIFYVILVQEKKEMFMFKRRWKPNKQQREQYSAKIKEAEELYAQDFIKTTFPIREGCFVEWMDKRTNDIFQGKVRRSTYGTDGQHTFTIDKSDGSGSKRVKGRNLYDRLLQHIPGEIAKDINHPLNQKREE